MKPAPLGLRSMLLSLVAAVGCGSGGPGGPPPPMPASSLAVTSTTTAHVVLDWTDNSPDEQGFAVERSSDGAPFAEVGRVGADVTRYEDTTIAGDSSYAYRVRAFGVGGLAAPSNEVTTTTYSLAALQAILGQYLLALTGTEIPPASVSVSVAGVTYTVTFEGFAFCMPPSPFAPPVASPTPPLDAFGCENALGVTLAPSGTGDSVLLTVSVPLLFIALSTVPPAGGAPAYVSFTDAQLTLDASLGATPDGREQIEGPVVVGAFASSSATFHSQDAFVDGLGSLMLGLVANDVEQQVQQVAASTFAADLALVPPYVP
jgi:hypothetical protein